MRVDAKKKYADRNYERRIATSPICGIMGSFRLTLMNRCTKQP